MMVVMPFLSIGMLSSQRFRTISVENQAAGVGDEHTDFSREPFLRSTFSAALWPTATASCKCTLPRSTAKIASSSEAKCGKARISSSAET